jgi:hypothetical protein
MSDGWWQHWVSLKAELAFERLCGIETVLGGVVAGGDSEGCQ